jgi:hypothetical protein
MNENRSNYIANNKLLLSQINELKKKNSEFEIIINN